MNDTKNRKENKYTHSDGDICIGIFIDHGEFFKHQGHRTINADKNQCVSCLHNLSVHGKRMKLVFIVVMIAVLATMVLTAIFL